MSVADSSESDFVRRAMSQETKGSCGPWFTMTQVNLLVHGPITLGLGIASLVIGIMTWDDPECDENHKLSLFLLVQGSLTLFVFLLSLLVFVLLVLIMKKVVASEVLSFSYICWRLTTLHIIIILLALFNFGWFIVGNVWLWRTSYCNEAYVMTMVYVICGYVYIAVRCYCRCFFEFITEELVINKGTPMYRLHNPCAPEF